MEAAMYMPGLRPGSMSWSIYREFASELRTVGVELQLLTDWHGELAASDDVTCLSVQDGGWPDRLVAPFTRTRSFISTARRLAGLSAPGRRPRASLHRDRLPWGGRRCLGPEDGALARGPGCHADG